jgi:hypothetical protein
MCFLLGMSGGGSDMQEATAGNMLKYLRKGTRK